MRGEVFIVGKKIKYFRHLRNVTQEELAKELGVIRQTVASWEKGVTSPDMETCMKIAEILNVQIEDLADDVKEDKSVPPTYRFLGTVTIGKDGKVKLPKKILDEMGVQAGDQMLVLADTERGVEFLPMDILWENTLKKYFVC